MQGEGLISAAAVARRQAQIEQCPRDPALIVDLSIDIELCLIPLGSLIESFQ